MRSKLGNGLALQAHGAGALEAPTRARAHAGARTIAPPRQGKAAQARADAALVGRVARRDREAMREIYMRHRPKVFRFALRILRDRTMAEDVSSEVFLDVWRRAEGFEGRSSVSTWILGITRIKAFSALRAPVDQELNDKIVDAIEDPGQDPAAGLQRKETGAIIRQCLTKLSAEHREIIDLVYYHEKSIAEASAIVGIPGNTVKTRMFCARKRLARLLKAAGVRHALA
jgi:RNA polymerase sigma-70 factor, ECF subfamily